MKFGKPLSEVSSGSGTRPSKGAYVMHTVSVKEEVSRAGNTMLTLQLDIANGEYANFFSRNPLNVRREYVTETGLAITKRYLTAYVLSNPHALKQSDIDGDSFDSSRLQGLLVGAVLGLDSRGYLEVKDLIPIGNVDAFNDESTSSTTTTTTGKDSVASFVL